MPKLLAGDIGWLCAGWVVAWMLGALVRLAAHASPRTTARAKPCRRRSKKTPRLCKGGRLMLALLSASPLALMVAGAADVAHALASALVGVLGGAWLARRYGFAVPPRFVAAAGGALGLAAVTGGFALDLLMPRDGALARAALYVGVSFGAWMLAASASAWLTGFTRGPARARFTAPATATAASPLLDDRIVYGLALTLCAALACGFVADETSAHFRLLSLVAACGLASALGVRMMTGVRNAAPRRALDAGGARAVVARADAGSFARISLAGISDEHLVAACAGETFDDACLVPFDAGSAARGGAPLAAVPRRHRSRYGGTTQPTGGRAH